MPSVVAACKKSIEIVEQSNHLRSEVLVQLHEGTKIIVEDQVEQWVKVRLANGTVGWLTQSDVQRIAF